MLCLSVKVPASEPETGWSYDAFNARMPVVRREAYVVNAKVRPLLLFWIGRDNIGDASLTWRENAGGHRAIEFLVGSDPARAPRRINRWGYIVEESGPGKAEVLGLMKESNEQTIADAEAQIAPQTGISAFKVSRTTISGSRALTGVVTIQAPAHFTYRELDSLLAIIPVESRRTRALELPPGTQSGFLLAMEVLLQASAGACQSRARQAARKLAAIPFVYGQTLYDLSLQSCTFASSVVTKTGIFTDVVQGKFQVRNRTTRYETRFDVSFGTSGAWRGLPVRAVFLPRWWMEIELLLDPGVGSTTEFKGESNAGGPYGHDSRGADLR